MDIDLLTAVTSLFSQHNATVMDEEDMSVPDSPLESGSMSPRQGATTDKQRATLQSYLDALPYKCETVEEMQANLEYIVGKIVVCAKSKNWLVLTTWDGALQWYVVICTESFVSELSRQQLAIDALPHPKGHAGKACSLVL